MSDVFKALSDPTRRAILLMLRDNEMTAGAIAERVSISKPTLSGHLNILKAADLIDVTRQGTSLIYRLNASVVEGALMGLMQALHIGQNATDKHKTIAMPESKS
jgi:ArsR family transcriptional regulator, arsenate/arsenite/antimonite-responsive transcriptional repressor